MAKPKKTPEIVSDEHIEIRGASEHNLKDIDVDIPINSLTVVTGISGSGKSTLAFDTLYAEGQRRYVESLSSYARQFLGVMNKPKVDHIRGLSPAISIEQKSVSHNPRSTVGTITEIYDYLRLLYARIGTPHCPLCNQEIFPQDAQSITRSLLKYHLNDKVQIMAPVVRGKKGHYSTLLEDLSSEGFVRARIDGEIVMIEDYIGKGKKQLERYKAHTIEVVIDRLVVKSDGKSRIQDSVEQAMKLSQGLVLVVSDKSENAHAVGTSATKEQLYSKHLACPDCNLNFEELQPRLFSFNSPFGACSVCHGLGFVLKFDPELVIPNKELTIWEGAILPWKTQVYGWKGQMIESVAEKIDLDLDEPITKWSAKQLDTILNGFDKPITYKFKTGNAENSYTGKFEGVMNELERLYMQTESDARKRDIEKYIQHLTCGSCKGARLKEEALAVTLEDKNIFEVSSISIIDTLEFFSTVKLTKSQTIIADEVLKEIRTRLQFLIDVGVGYLTLSRSAGTLSGGEAQRIRLATQIGSELRGVLYILDEPSIGLHQRDNQKLINTLKHLRDLKNTVIVVEHDKDTIEAADYVIDIGPGAGVHGGEVIACGTPAEIKKNNKSLTGRFLANKEKIEVPSKRRRIQNFLKLQGASGNNLKNVDVSFPIGVFTCVTGVSGSGKSTLIIDTLYSILAQKLNKAKTSPASYTSIENLGHIDKVIVIDQSPIGRTPRSNPATYTKVFTYIRELFSQTKEAKVRGYKPGRFSFNVAEGRCSNCEGDGVIKIEMNFLSDVYITCEVCKGRRYNDETLEVMYKDKTIEDILDMTVEHALYFFGHIPKIKKKLETLADVGLGYVKLGQSATTLSGGEAQRVKLSTELSKRDTGQTFYILDEPTTGLHFADTRRLLGILDTLVEKGNTVLVIEHDLDVIKTADYIIDLGPDGGDGGGEIVAAGTPEEVVNKPRSYTGQYLKKLLKK